MTRVSREANVDLSEYFCERGFGDGDDTVSKAVGIEWRDAVIDWINEGLKAAELDDEFEAARDEAGSLHNDCMIALQPKCDENGERLRRDERSSIDLSAIDMGEFLDRAEEADPRLRGLFNDVNRKLEEAISEGVAPLSQVRDKLMRIATLAAGEEPRAKDKILALCEETISMINFQRGSS